MGQTNKSKVSNYPTNCLMKAKGMDWYVSGIWCNKFNVNDVFDDKLFKLSVTYRMLSAITMYM